MLLKCYRAEESGFGGGLNNWFYQLLLVIYYRSKMRVKRACYLRVFYYLMLKVCYLVVYALAYPFDRSIDPVYLQKPDGYLAYTELITAEVGQVQDFICPGNQEFALYLVSRTAFQMCDVEHQLLLHNCLTYKFSKVCSTLL